MASKVQVIDGVGYAELQDTLLVLWKEPASLERWRENYKRLKAAAATRKEGVIYLSLVDRGSTPPNAAARAQITADLRELGGALRRFIAVPLGDSVWLSIVRTIIRGMLMLSGQSQQQRVAASLREGFEHVREAAGPNSPSVEELERAVEALTTALGVERPDPA